MESLENQLSAILNDYSDELRDEVEQAIKTSADTTTKLLRTVADQLHHRTGEYAKGWTVTKVESTWKGVQAIIYNKSKPGLAHLLNNGHAKRGGGRVSGDGHIDDVTEFAQENLFNEVEKMIRQ